MWLVVGCAAPAAAPPKAPVATEKPAASAPKPAQVPPPDELYQRLTAQPRAESVLAALPNDVREVLERKVQLLTAEDRRVLLDPAQPYAYQRPLLHLVAGGEVLGAYSALFSSSAGSDEVLDARYEVGRFEDLPEVVTEVATRAARHVLAGRTAAMAPGLARKKEILGEIAAAAEFLGDDPIYVAALAALEHDFPEQQWSFMRAGALARRLQPELARAALPSGPSLDAGMARSAETLIASAEQAQKPVQSIDDAVAVARAQLQLDRADGALEVLAPFAEQESTHLALAATALRARSGTGPCPAVRSPLGNGLLCRVAWQKFLTPERIAVLEGAWRSGAGRDVDGVDVWLGLSHVVPMTYGLQEGVSAALAHLKGLAEGAKAAAAIAPEYPAIEVLASALQQAVTVSPGEQAPSMGELPKAARKQLVERALALYQTAPNDSWTQAALLGIVAMLAPYEDGRATLTKLNETVRAEWRISHGSLLLWSFLASGDSKAFVQNKGLLGRAAQVSAEASYERSRWVILWAEAEAHLEPSQRSYGIVGELAQRLSGAQAPLDLRLRTAIDAAGLRARQGDYAGAAELLTPVVQNTPRSSVSTRQEQDLLVVASGYEHVLRGLASNGTQRLAEAAKLTQLVNGISQASAAPPTIVRWLNAWAAELAYRTELETCAGDRICEQKAKRPLLAKGVLDKELGPQMANLLRRGVLPVGGIELEFRYRSGRLFPQVNVEPAFLLVTMPTLDGTVKAAAPIQLPPAPPPAAAAPPAGASSAPVHTPAAGAR